MAVLSQEPQTQPPTTTKQASAREPETWPFKGVEDKCNGNKGDIDRSSQADEGMLSMPREDITPL